MNEQLGKPLVAFILNLSSLMYSISDLSLAVSLFIYDKRLIQILSKPYYYDPNTVNHFNSKIIHCIRGFYALIQLYFFISFIYLIGFSVESLWNVIGTYLTIIYFSFFYDIHFLSLNLNIYALDKINLQLRRIQGFYFDVFDCV